MFLLFIRNFKIPHKTNVKSDRFFDIDHETMNKYQNKYDENDQISFSKTAAHKSSISAQNDEKSKPSVLKTSKQTLDHHPELRLKIQFIQFVIKS